MIPFIQSAENPSQIPLAFDQAASRGITGLRWAVAYITEAGARQLVDRLRQKIGKPWVTAPKLIVTSCDYGITEPGAIDYFAGMDNCRIMLASPDVITREGFRPIRAFHPKLYLFTSRVGMSAIIGSANLTVRAFTNNYEAVSLYSSTKVQAVWESAWTNLTSEAVDFTPELLAQYRQARVGHNTLIDIDPPTLPEPPVNGVTPVFLNEIDAGRLVPGTFGHLWVQAGSMSSSASNNQLELPRGGNRYFDHSFDQYDKSRREIGRPRLLVRGCPFNDRQLVWHGNNRMETIYLPTQSQSGLAYKDQLVVFRRTALGFDLDVFPWESAAAIACRNASQRINRVYRLGASSERICGVY